MSSLSLLWAIVVMVMVHFGGVELSKLGDFKTATNVSNKPDISKSEIIIGPGNVPILSTSSNLNKLGEDGDQHFIKVMTGTHQNEFINNKGPSEGKVVKYCQGFVNSLKKIGNPWTNLTFALLSDNETKLFSVQEFLKLKLEEGIPFCETLNEISVAKLISVLKEDELKQRLPNDVGSIGFLHNGYFKIGRHFYNTDEYCVAGISEERVDVKYCPEECTRMRPCVKKCSPPGQVMGFSTGKRVGPISSGQFEFSPTFHDDYPKKGQNVNLENIKPHFMQNRPMREFKCFQDENKNSSVIPLLSPFSPLMAETMSNFTNKTFFSLRFRLQIDGRLFYELLDDYNCPTWQELPTTDFCLDRIHQVGTENIFTNKEDEGLLITCPLPNRQIIVSLLFGVLMLASSFFLLVTFIVYVLLWHQQNIHGWTIMAHTASLYFTYIFLGMAHIIRATPLVSLIKTTFCYISGVLGHFFFLSTFSWLTLISFDLWLTFRSIVPTRKTKGARMLSHLLIGWGLPAVVVIVSVCLDLIIGDQCSSIILPKYGAHVCYLHPSAQGLYLYYPVAITLLCNVIFFCATVYKLYYYKKNTRVASKNNPNNRQLFAVFTKLFFVMGVTWSFEFISWLHVGSNVPWYWVIIDVLNILQAVAIFYIYVCKPDILESLETKYPNSLNKYILRFIRRATSGGIEMKGRESSRGGKASFTDGAFDGDELKTKTSSLTRTS